MRELYFYLWYLMIYAGLGWCAEVAYAAVKLRKFVNRGFLNGPVCPIYGFGVCIVIFFLKPLEENLAVLFFGAVILTSVLEFLTGYVLDKVYHEHWWDYSAQPLNLHGYICPTFSLLWGVACVLVLRFLHPPIQAAVAWLPHGIGLAVLSFLLGILVIDFVSTTMDLQRFHKAMRLAESISKRLKELSDDMGGGISDAVLQTIEKKEEIKIDVDDFRAEKRDRYLQSKSELLLELYVLLVGTEKSQRRIRRAYPNLSRAAVVRRMEEYKAIVKEKLRRG